MTTRKPIIAGNWKMNGTRNSVQDLLTAIKNEAPTISNADLVVFPPTVFLEQTEHLLTGTSVAWGGQNLYFEPFGAFTGEISSGMLCEFGCRYVLVGHSERRSLLGETDRQVGLKYQAALQTGLTPVVCVGETLEERNSHLTYKVLRRQLDAIFLISDEIDHLHQMVIAYEPVWAIGTGLTAQPEVAQEIHAQIRDWVAEYNPKVAKELRILYGGSLKKDNAAALFAMPDIDGGLIGGASLNATEFLDIARSCSN